MCGSEGQWCPAGLSLWGQQSLAGAKAAHQLLVLELTAPVLPRGLEALGSCSVFLRDENQNQSALFFQSVRVQSG